MKSMTSSIRRFLREEDGAAAVEYGLLVALIALAVAAVVITLGTNLKNVFTKIGQDASAFRGWSSWLAQFTVLLPALIGIGLGRNPSGFLSDAFARYGTMIRDVFVVFLGGVASELVLWFLAFRRVIDNWAFAIGTAVLLVALPRVAELVRPAARLSSAHTTGAVNATPIELIGIDRAFTADDVAEMNRQIGLPSRVGVDGSPA